MRRRFDDYRNLLSTALAQSGKADLWSDYLQCAKTLFLLTQDSSILDVLKQEREDLPVELQGYAAVILREIDKPKG